MKFKCAICGQLHDEWPALAFSSPTAYNVLSESVKKEIAGLSNDFCVIHHPEQTDRFIRCTLTQKVIDSCQNLDYGLWVSLSEKSFNDYKENFRNSNHVAKYFGWLSNDLAEYEVIESIPTTVFTRTNGNRPEIIPHEDCNHPFVLDYYNGITKEEAERRINEMIRIVKERDGSKE